MSVYCQIPGDDVCKAQGFHGHGVGADHQVYLYGRPYHCKFQFRWRKPKVVVYQAAKRQRLPKLTLNRYPGIVIGAALLLRGDRVVSLVWGKPGPSYEVQA